MCGVVAMCALREIRKYFNFMPPSLDRCCDEINSRLKPKTQLPWPYDSTEPNWCGFHLIYFISTFIWVFIWWDCDFTFFHKKFIITRILSRLPLKHSTNIFITRLVAHSFLVSRQNFPRTNHLKVKAKKTWVAAGKPHQNLYFDSHKTHHETFSVFCLFSSCSSVHS